ncbi:MAG TPA: alkaline shock response membrane anchor protein AmaP [Candidatus Aerophobetes bacterium]|uniref:Alkaline shock response membrane anchor protein AmaP n=1 Tax=Aerophobetes bacterium TaxID=2030807 RepID=A0A7V5HXW7_UNCAE|nr:alkaline shock response membrane anchor protein AmaP [Candidatus Aerophobetes bacterium]
MKIYQKVLWIIGLVSLAAFSIGGLTVSTGAMPKILIFSALTAVELNFIVKLITTVVFAFLLFLSIYLPIFTWTEKKGTIIPLRNPLGEIEISQRAISDFIQRVGREVEGVQDLKAKVRSTEEGVDVELSLSVQAQGEIPRLIDELQNVIKKYLNTTVGIENVREIKVKVGKIV